MTSFPLIVGLNGTLIHNDALHEAALRMLQRRPLDLLCLPLWIISGKATLKECLSQKDRFDPSALPYNTEFVAWLRQQKEQGRRLILCTASDRSIPDAIAAHLGFFDEVIANENGVNLSCERKAALLEERFGKGGFDYAGNANADLEIWQKARHAVIVNASASVAAKAEKICEIEKIFPTRNLGFTQWAAMLRVHQWLKNLLLFMPVVAAHKIASPAVWMPLGLAFLSFSACASSVYIANDLLDLESDRKHPHKCSRPFASGLMPAWVGFLLAPALLAFSMLMAAQIDGSFTPWLIFYFIITTAYSMSLKRIVLLDCLILAMLYTLRIVAGAAAINMDLSFWLLAFSVFLFLSLAFVKRYAELEVLVLNGREKAHGRGYYTTDAPLLQTMGIASGYASITVLALYLNSEAVLQLYRAPQFIWGAVPVTLFWISWMWMQAHRGKMHDDPLIFAIKDRTSLLAGVVFIIVMIVGALGLPW